MRPEHESTRKEGLSCAEGCKKDVIGSDDGGREERALECLCRLIWLQHVVFLRKGAKISEIENFYM